MVTLSTFAKQSEARSERRESQIGTALLQHTVTFKYTNHTSQYHITSGKQKMYFAKNFISKKKRKKKTTISS